MSNASKPRNRRGNPTKCHAMFIVPWPRSPSIGCAQRHRDAKLLPLHQLNVGSRPGWRRSKCCQIMSQQMDCSTTIKSEWLTYANVYGPAFCGSTPCPNSCTSTSCACWDHTMGPGTWSGTHIKYKSSSTTPIITEEKGSASISKPPGFDQN